MSSSRHAAFWSFASGSRNRQRANAEGQTEETELLHRIAQQQGRRFYVYGGCLVMFFSLIMIYVFRKEELMTLVDYSSTLSVHRANAGENNLRPGEIATAATVAKTGVGVSDEKFKNVVLPLGKFATNRPIIQPQQLPSPLQEPRPPIPVQIEYPFKIQMIPHQSKPFDPEAFEYHSTRYLGGCMMDIDEGLKRSYSYINPWLRNFDLLVTSCAMDWRDAEGSRNSQSACIYAFNAQNAEEDEKSNKTIKIHVHSDSRHQKYFLESMLPFFEQRSARTNGSAKIIVFSGGGDASVGRDVAEAYLNAASIKRWGTEQNVLGNLAHLYPRFMALPLGICARETRGSTGKGLRENLFRDVELEGKGSNGSSVLGEQDAKLLRRMLHEQEWTTYTRLLHNAVREARQLDNSSSPSLHASSTAPNMSSSTSFSSSSSTSSSPSSSSAINASWREKRLNRVLFCFNEMYDERKAALDWARNNCSFCDVCEHNDVAYNSLLEHSNGSSSISSNDSIDTLMTNSKANQTVYIDGQLSYWKAVARYKFVFSPFGNAPDCFRSWEILLLGAIPVMNNWPGLAGYLQGGLSVVSIEHITNVNEKNLQRWIDTFTHPTPVKRLTRQYWEDQAFGSGLDDVPIFTAEPSATPTAAPTNPTNEPSLSSSPSPTTTLSTGFNTNMQQQQQQQQDQQQQQQQTLRRSLQTEGEVGVSGNHGTYFLAARVLLDAFALFNALCASCTLFVIWRMAKRGLLTVNPYIRIIVLMTITQAFYDLSVMLLMECGSYRCAHTYIIFIHSCTHTQTHKYTHTHTHTHLRTLSARQQVRTKKPVF